MQDAPEVDIEKLAQLSRIHLTEEEKASLGGQVAEIVGFFKRLQEVDVEGIRPMAHPFDAAAPLREDRPGPSWEAAKALRNAPAQRLDQVVVPKVVENA